MLLRAVILNIQSNQNNIYIYIKMDTIIFDKWSKPVGNGLYQFKIEDDVFKFASEFFKVSIEQLFQCELFVNIIHMHSSFVLDGEFIESSGVDNGPPRRFTVNFRTLKVDKHIVMQKTSHNRVYNVDGIIMVPGEVEKIQACLVGQDQNLVNDYYDLYVYGYPLVIMDITRKTTGVPVNTTINYQITPEFKQVVLPNLDTYYTNAWIDLTEGPVIIKLPEINRYYMVPFLDAFTNVFKVFGTRNTGSGPYTIFMTNENWKGNPPKNTILVRAPTNLVWMIARIRVTSEYDGLTNVVPLQNKIEVYSYKSTSIIPVKQLDVVPTKYIENMPIEEFFNYLSMLLKDNPPAKIDKEIKHKMEKLGIIPGKQVKFVCPVNDLNSISKTVHDSWNADLLTNESSFIKDSWLYLLSIGSYGVDYYLRGFVARIGLGANLGEDAIYPLTNVDSTGERLNGKYNYIVKFSSQPPVNGFWSLTLYRQNGQLFENPEKIYFLGDKDDLIYNEDGTFEIQVKSKFDKGNWLPSPSNDFFSLVLRLYWPSEKILSYEWPLPKVIRT